MAIELDKLHINMDDINRLESYNRRNIAIISPREPGKTTMPFVRRSYFKFKASGARTLALVRYAADIDDLYIRSIEGIINKFTDDNVTLDYRMGPSRVTSVYINKKLFRAIIPRNAPTERFKKLVMPFWAIHYDEFIANTYLNEKYIPGEAFKYEEMVKTFKRENPSLRCWFYGNPYSVYNPFFSSWGVDFSKIKPGALYTNSNCVIWCATLKPELIAQIKARDPGYVFDDSYERYAFGGQAINDENKLIIPQQPRGFRLVFAVRYDEKTLGVFEGRNNTDPCFFWVGFIKEEGARRQVYCYSFKDLIENTALVTYDNQAKFRGFVSAIACRQVGYQNLEASYQGEALYQILGGRCK